MLSLSPLNTRLVWRQNCNFTGIWAPLWACCNISAIASCTCHSHRSSGRSSCQERTGVGDQLGASRRRRRPRSLFASTCPVLMLVPASRTWAIDICTCCNQKLHDFIAVIGGGNGKDWKLFGEGSPSFLDFVVQSIGVGPGVVQQGFHQWDFASQDCITEWRPSCGIPIWYTLEEVVMQEARHQKTIRVRPRINRFCFEVEWNQALHWIFTHSCKVKMM